MQCNALLLSKHLCNLKVCVDFLCLNFGLQVDGTRNPMIVFSAVHGVILLKIADYFAVILLQIITFVRTVYSMASHLEHFFDFQVAHRLSRTGLTPDCMWCYRLDALQILIRLVGRDILNWNYSVPFVCI